MKLNNKVLKFQNQKIVLQKIKAYFKTAFKILYLL